MLREHIKIVMVEDDEGHAKLIEKNLRRAGISNKIIHLDSGEKAINYFFGEKERTDTDKILILLDLNLPEIDGYEILARIKGNEKTKNIPVIILTTTDNPREIDRCYDLGCNVYITKPVEYENFSSAIQKFGLMLSVVRLPNPK